MNKKFWLIVGLGNPGNEFKSNRHNAGFRCLDYFARINNINFKSSNLFSQIAEIKIDGEKSVLIRPNTYMNLSGKAVKSCLDYFKSDIDHLLVIQDDTALPVGKMRIKTKGSAGGHNGLKSIIEYLNTNEFKRIKIGVGACPDFIDMKDWVVMDLTKPELEITNNLNQYIVEAISLIIKGNIEKAMNEYN